MQTYELLCLLKAGFDIENTDHIISNIEKAINNLGGNITSSNKIGRKRLAYVIAKQRDSFYVTFNIEIEPDKLKELKRYFKLNDTVLRNLISVLKPNSKEVVVA